MKHFDVWHKGATLHPLTETADQEACLRIIDRALLPDSHAITGTFALGGPTSCFAAALLFARLDKRSDWDVSLKHYHNTPSGSLKHFHLGVFRKA